ncbi:glucose PTS transporter subunit IIA [Mesomycoplasma moatsii]|uniref:PTS transporter subunit IIABC n=1 Tax=Mesomycoplasma moatsii TaxID=171287 RepID=UPI0003B36E88
MSEKITKKSDNPIKNIFLRKNKKVSTKTGGGMKAFLSKLSGAFLLPISVLAIAGLFLGVGATIASNSPSGSAGETFGNFIKQLGDPLFGALPLLFAAAIAVSFTEEAGVAVFNAIIGYLIFSALQSVFINPVYDSNKDIVGYKILFSGGWRTPSDLKALIGSSLGFSVMQTSVFGGIIVGFVVQWAYNRFHTIQLPQVISFFGGKRFVALAVVILMIPLVFTFLLFWPYIGYIFNWIGKNSGKIPYGFDSFIFGFIERSLVPFGLHHVFYSPLWYTSAGGDVSVELQNWLKQDGNKILASDFASIIHQLKGEVVISNPNEYISWDQISSSFKPGSVNGDSSTTLALIGVNTNTVHYEINGQKGSKSLFMFIQDELGLKLGRFLDGKFSFMQWGLPFAGLAMVLAAPKENRKVALGTIFPAALTCFVTGVTEPLEFTFLFLAPILFFGFHAFFCAVSFLMANILSVHIGMAFSGGFLDLIVYGMIPILKGTNFWWTIVVGMAYIPIYFFGFYFWIKKADLPTPGRGGNTKLFTKKDYQQAKSNNENNTFGIESQILEIIDGFGGRENITKTANCATRLRFDVKNMNLVNEEKLKTAGAFGVRKNSETHLQVIFGPIADQLRIKIDNAINEIDKNPDFYSDKKEERLSNQQNQIKTDTKLESNIVDEIVIKTPTNGKVKSLESLNDGVFSAKLLGVGFAIEQTDGNVYSPIDGKLVTVFPTKHAYGIETNDGLSILVHIGIDTVSLNGEGFESFVEQGQKVKKGDLLAKVDLNILKEHNLNSDVICVVTTDSKIQPKNIRIKK